MADTRSKILSFTVILEDTASASCVPLLYRICDGYYRDSDYLSHVDYGRDFRRLIELYDVGVEAILHILRYRDLKVYHASSLPSPSEIIKSVNFDIVIISFSLTNTESWERAKQRVIAFKREAPEKIITLTSDLDLISQQRERAVAYKEVADFAEHFSITYLESSAKNDINIDQLLLHSVDNKLKQKSSPPANQAATDNQEQVILKAIWSNPKNKTIEDKILALLNDYTKNNSRIDRFFSGHWGRNHLGEVNDIVLNCQNKDADWLIQELKKIALKNPNGTLSKRIALIDLEYIIYKYEKERQRQKDNFEHQLTQYESKRQQQKIDVENLEKESHIQLALSRFLD